MRGTTIRRSIAAIAGTALATGGALAMGVTPAAADVITLFSSSTPGVYSIPLRPDVCAVTVTADGGHGGAGAETTPSGNLSLIHI